MARLKAHDDRLDKIDNKSFVPFTNFKWVVGIIVGMIISLYGFSFKTMYNSETKLTEIKIKQQITIHKLESLQNNVKELRR